MDSAEKLQVLRVMVGVPNTQEGWGDDILLTFLDIAKHKILQRLYPYHPKKKKIPPQYHMLECEIAAFLLNKRGAEGQIAHTENGITRQYEVGDVPESMFSAVVPYCGVI